MEITYLSEFIHLANSHSYTDTARDLHLSQPALSRHIKSLEDELGQRLFLRDTRNVQLTEFGVSYLPYASSIWSNYVDSLDFLNNYSQTSKQRVIFGAPRRPELYGLDTILLAFKSEHPEVSLRIVEGNVKDLDSLFRKGEIDAMCTAVPEMEQRPYHYVELQTSRIVAVLPKEHKLAALEAIPFDKITESQLLLPDKGTYVYNLLKYYIQESVLDSVSVFHGDLYGASNLVKSGFGVLIQDQTLATQLLDDNLVMRRLQPDISYPLCLAYHNVQSDASQKLVKFITETVAARNLENKQ